MNSSGADYRRQEELLEGGCKNSRFKVQSDTLNLEAFIPCLDFIIDDTLVSNVFVQGPLSECWKLSYTLC